MMKRILFLIVILSIVSCSTSNKQSGLIELRESINLFNKAFEQADNRTLAQMITDNYVHTNSSWKSFGKEEWLGYMEKRKDRIESGELKISNYRTEELEIELMGQSAIVTGKIVMDGVEDGESFHKEIRITNFWVVDEGIWKRAGFHDTRIGNL